MNKLLIVVIISAVTSSFNVYADWKTNIFGTDISGSKDTSGFYVEYRQLQTGGTLRRNSSSDYNIDGGYEFALGLTKPIRERLVFQVGGSIGSIDIINVDNNNETESLTKYTIDAKAQQLNFFGPVKNPIALALGLGGGMNIIPSYQLKNQSKEQMKQVDIFLAPSIGLHYAIFELGFEYRVNMGSGNYSLISFKLIY